MKRLNSKAVEQTCAELVRAGYQPLLGQPPLLEQRVLFDQRVVMQAVE